MALTDFLMDSNSGALFGLGVQDMFSTPSYGAPDVAPMTFDYSYTVPQEQVFASTQQYMPDQPLMNLADSPLYQSYVQNLQDQQQQAYDINLKQLKQDLATQGLLGGTAIEEITDLTSRSFQKASPHEIMMPYLMGISQSGMGAAQDLGSMGGQFGGMMNAALSQYGQGMGGAFGGLSGSITDAYTQFGDQAVAGGNLGAQGAMSPMNSLMGGLNIASGLGGLV